MTRAAVRLLPAAEQHVTLAYQWYEGQRDGLGSEFLDEIAAFCDRISQQPGLCPVHRHTIRRGLLHRFPYLMFYVVEPSSIAVIGVLHAHRDPQDWP